jgi:hypothetical protein
MFPHTAMVGRQSPSALSSSGIILAMTQNTLLVFLPIGGRFRSWVSSPASFSSYHTQPLLGFQALVVSGCARPGSDRRLELSRQTLYPSELRGPRVERQNLTIRIQMRRLTRLTNAFSKKWENLWAAYCLHFAYYNFCRIHQSLRVTRIPRTSDVSRSSQVLASTAPRRQSTKTLVSTRIIRKAVSSLRNAASLQSRSYP